MKYLKDLDIKNKRVFLRADLNVPLKDGKILDFTRIEKVIPTINYILSKKAKLIIASHFGRPKNGYEEKYSLKFLRLELENLLGQNVLFTDVANVLKVPNSPSRIILLENIRFYPGEVANDENFARQLANMADVYVNDAFACCHRAHASIDRITSFLPSAAGFLMQEELENLNFYLESPKAPVIAIIGGSKVSTKLDLILNLVNKVDQLIIGGAMANTFLKALGKDIASSFFEPELVAKAKEILDSHSSKILLPHDYVVATEISKDAQTRIVTRDEPLNKNEMILDIGPETIELIEKTIEKAATIIMNGPVGVFEYPPFKKGTLAIAIKVAELTQTKNITSIAGGGDIVAAINQANLFNQFSYISTAGGAFLEWLEGKTLPGIKALGNGLESSQ